MVEEILDAGKRFDFGLEVGSKPELFAGLALQNQVGSLIICNGYKDAEFVKMAMLGLKLGKKVILVVEKLEELWQIIALSKQLGVQPQIGGIRARLLAKGGCSASGWNKGRWPICPAKTSRWRPRIISIAAQPVCSSARRRCSLS